jgi:drug/metabolite transporter (DMT)-like permease
MQNIKAYIFLVLCTLFWAGNFIVGKVASLFEIPPFSLNFYRWLIAFIILFPFTYKKITENFHEIKKKNNTIIYNGLYQHNYF